LPAALLLLCLIVNACQTKEPVKPAASIQAKQIPVRFADAGQAANYRNHHLEQIGKMALGLSLYPEIKALLYKKIEQRFDGEYNVLMDTLLKEGEPYQLQKKTTYFLQSDNWQSSLDAFKKSNIGVSDDLLPQIYIPFYEDLKQQNLLNTKPPIVAVAAPHGAASELEGFTLNEKGRIVKVSTPVTEVFAQLNEVWIISSNERIVNGKVVSYPQTQKSSSLPARSNVGCIDGIANPNDRPTANGLNVIVPVVQVKCHKEEWYNGGSEVRIIMTTENCTGVDPITGVWDTRGYWKIHGYRNYDGEYQNYDLGEWTRKQVKDKSEKWINMSITDWYNSTVKNFATLDWGEKGNPNWGDDTRKACLYYVIFESDYELKPDDPQGSPEVRVNSTDPLGGTGTNAVYLKYPSEDDAYTSGYWTWYKDHPLYPCGWEFEDGCIKVNVTVSEGR
jgi:hypothetical protein